MKTLSFWKKSMYSGLIFFGTVTALTIGYSNYISSLPASVGSGSGLTASEWNKMVTSLSELDTTLTNSNLTFSGGKIGIGAWNPSAKFHVTDGNSNLRFGYNLSAGSSGPSLMLETTSNVLADIVWNTAGANQVRLRGSSYGLAIGGTNPRLNIGYPDANYTSAALAVNGNVGIGTTSPGTTLQVAGAHPSTRPIISLKNSNAWTTYTGEFRWIDGNGNNGWAIANNTLIGSNYLEFNEGSTNRMYIAPGGNITVAGTLTQNSDIHLKKDITPIENSLEKIFKLNGVNYYWKDSTRDTRKQIGVIAQEVEQVLPELVSTDKKGIKSVNYAGLVAPLIEAVKEQQKQITALQTEVQILKDKQ